MNRSLIRFAAILAAVTTAACASATTVPGTTSENELPTATSVVRARLIGSWTFVRGCGGIAGWCRPAEELGAPTRYVFRSDDSVEAYRGTQRLYVLNYVLAPGAAKGSGGDERPALLIGAGPAVDPLPLRVSFVGDTTLLLDQGCCDMFAFEYRRGS